MIQSVVLSETGQLRGQGWNRISYYLGRCLAIRRAEQIVRLLSRLVRIGRCLSSHSVSSTNCIQLILNAPIDESFQGRV